MPPEIDIIGQRRARLAQQRVRSGLLTLTGDAALAAVGFRPVSEVMGAISTTVSYAPVVGNRTLTGQNGRGLYSAGTRPAGWQGDARGGPPRVHTSSMTGGSAGTSPRIDALKNGYGVALSRLVAEAKAVGADGVVGLTVRRDQRETNDGTLVWTFDMTGTAVRSTGRVHPETPFTSALSATETAAALHAGWVPVSFVVCPVMAVRWVEPGSRQQRRRRAPSGEITAYTAAVATARHQARVDLTRAAGAVHADGAVLHEITTEISPMIDLAQVTVVVTGTALAQFRVPPRPSPTPIVMMRLR